jgi:hypothetical protein
MLGSVKCDSRKNYEQLNFVELKRHIFLCRKIRIDLLPPLHISLSKFAIIGIVEEIIKWNLKKFRGFVIFGKGGYVN